MQAYQVLHGWRPVEAVWVTMALHGRVAPIGVDQVDPTIVRSWQRCILRHNPRSAPREIALSPKALSAVMSRNMDLLLNAFPVMEDLYQFTEGTECAIVLTDSTGCVLNVMGDPETCAAFREFGVKPGVYWSEHHMGTNAIGLTLLEAMPVLVAGPEHFYERFHVLTTAAAPVYNMDGRLVGTLGVVTWRRRTSQHLLAAVMGAARAITTQLQMDVYVREVNRRLSELQTVFQAISDGLLAWNREGIITHINSQAAQLLGVNASSVLGRPLEQVCTLPLPLQEAIARQEPVRDIEVTLTVQGASVECVVSLEPIWEGKRHLLGFIMTLRSVERVRHLVHRFVGSQAGVSLEYILGRSATMHRVRREIRVAARATAPVLICGENGVGKSLVARIIHQESSRADGPFLAINCQAIPRELMLAEFLGYERGAFTGARREGRPSKFELAHRGTLFLDQIEVLPVEVQAAILQVLDEGAVMRLGGTRLIPVDVRIIAATSVNLEHLMQEGHFNAELYYRLNAFIVTIPPLRAHLDDLPLYVERILQRLSQVMGFSVRVADEVWPLLHRYPWPGNVRELESVLEQAVLRTEDGLIRPEHLPPNVRAGRPGFVTNGFYQPVMTLEEAEREAILRAARACRGRVTEMAKVLGISRTTLWRRLKALRIDLEPFRRSSP